jgi:diguanylate cyclase (GGDEF)-like protein
LRIAQSNRRIYEMLPSLRTAGTGLGAERDEAVQGLRGSLSSAFVDGQVHDHNGKIALPDGAYRYFQSICAPVIDDGNVVFVVGVVRDMTDRITVQQQLEEKTDELRRTNRLLARLAITDGLTQLYNRRHFDEILYKEIKRFNRRKYTSLALMLIDIDHFKQMNDRYGHLAGDNVLRELATILKQEVRETDTVARYGGEEFAVIMPDTHIDGAAYKADLLRQRVQTVEIRGVEPPIRITISIGVAEYVSGFPHDLVQAADKALYQAKQDGRNTVVVRRRDEVEA